MTRRALAELVGTAFLVTAIIASGIAAVRLSPHDVGLQLLEKAVQKTKNDYRHHAWGSGAIYMESWGLGALAAGKLDVAEEAFLEALAHDAGSARSAMGLQVLCERQGRTSEAGRYAALAKKFWGKATTQHFEGEFNWIRSLGDSQKTSKK